MHSEPHALHRGGSWGGADVRGSKRQGRLEGVESERRPAERNVQMVCRPGPRRRETGPQRDSEEKRRRGQELCCRVPPGRPRSGRHTHLQHRDPGSPARLRLLGPADPEGLSCQFKAPPADSPPSWSVTWDHPLGRYLEGQRGPCLGVSRFPLRRRREVNFGGTRGECIPRARPRPAPVSPGGSEGRGPATS